MKEAPSKEALDGGSFEGHKCEGGSFEGSMGAPGNRRRRGPAVGGGSNIEIGSIIAESRGENLDLHVGTSPLPFPRTRQPINKMTRASVPHNYKVAFVKYVQMRFDSLHLPHRHTVRTTYRRSSAN